MRWLRRPPPPAPRRLEPDDPRPAAPRFTGPAEYRTLHVYLRDRFADTVVLTFAQIEDLLGFALPEGARLRDDWWASDAAHPSAHARTWTQAQRTATPHLLARTVAFERV